MAFAKIDVALATDNAVVAAVTGKRIRVFGYVMTAAGAVVATWKSATTALSGAMTMATGVPVMAPTAPLLVGRRAAVIETAPGEALNLTLGGAVQVSGHLEYEYSNV